VRLYREHDPRFRSLVFGNAQLERLWTGGRWNEGPVYVPAAKAVLWSDIPNDRVLRWDESSGAVSVFESPCGFHNGHTLDHQGRVIACEHGGRRVSRLDHDGVWRPLAERFKGQRFNSPNDVVVHSDGSIWFTDPSYGIDSDYEGHAAESELGIAAVYRLDPADGSIERVVDDMARPNGLAFSPDERILYIADTGRSHDDSVEIEIRAYDIGPDGRPADSEQFATRSRGFFDGFRVDDRGNVWTSAGSGVAVYAPDGTKLGALRIPEVVSNVCFGGPKRNRLFITTTTSLYSLYVNASGAVG
jgi:gluconolactonase